MFVIDFFNRWDQMDKEIKVSCTRPSLKQNLKNEDSKVTETIIKEDEYKMIKVGKPAPDRKSVV